MNTKISRAGAALLVTILLVACGSTPQSNHYLLTSMIDEVPSGGSPSLGVGPVDIPEYLNRDSMVYRVGDNQLQITSSERWAEPLGDGVSRVLSLNLASLLNTGDIQTFPFHPRRKPDFGVKLRVHSLDSRDSSARLVAEWLLYRPANGDPLQRRLTTLETSLNPQQAIPGQIPGAYSELLWQLSQEIAASINSQLAPTK